MMHDGPGAALGIFIYWFGVIGLSAGIKYVIKKCSTEGTAEQIAEKTPWLKYSIGWSDLQNERN